MLEAIEARPLFRDNNLNVERYGDVRRKLGRKPDPRGPWWFKDCNFGKAPIRRIRIPNHQHPVRRPSPQLGGVDRSAPATAGRRNAEHGDHAHFRTDAHFPSSVARAATLPPAGPNPTADPLAQPPASGPSLPNRALQFSVSGAPYILHLTPACALVRYSVS